ncbi:nuclear transport factor 2 family protein [Leifsonia sp. AG29]|uniref:nuclear transport factor 2 family protein n=1 Tax=Leifsonia sp. AG29 TaxID=2598860 RepID=UPI00131BEE06|nr:nuclear transport factor 2 family protein [Leifsonia sp. AG29]
MELERGIGVTAGEEWVQRYLIAWRSNDPNDIRALFTEDAVYEYEPSAEPLRGREAIVRSWVDHPDQPGIWSFEWKIFLERPGLAIVRGCTDYVGRKLFDNLWIVQLAEDGRATRFTEWFMERPLLEAPESDAQRRDQ